MTTPHAAPQEKAPVGKIIGFVGCGCLGILALVIGGGALFFFTLQGKLAESEPYQETLALIQSHPDAIALLGEPIEPSKIATNSNLSINNGERTLKATVNVSGPKGRGIMIIEAHKGTGSKTWEYNKRYLQVTEPENTQIPLQP